MNRNKIETRLTRGFLRTALLFILAARAIGAPTPHPPRIAWRESIAMPEPTSGYAAGVMGGNLVIIGGTYWEGAKGNWTKKIFTSAVCSFDPAAPAWKRLPDAPMTLGYPAFSEVKGDLYIMGGFQDGEPSRRVMVLSRLGDRFQWHAQTPLPETRLFASAVTVGTTLYVIGGTREFEPFDSKGTCCTSATATDTVWTLDTAESSPRWKSAAREPGELRWGQKAVSDGTDIYVFGGSFQAKQSDPVKMTNEVARYEPKVDRWTRVADMPQTMQGATPVFVRGGVVLIASAKKAMFFNIKTSTFSSIEPLPEDAAVDQFVQIGALLVGAGGENSIEGPRRRSAWTFIGSPGNP